ncbi:BTB domain-containing protein [Mycena venus]|uniref:BTB domain-containing protein n=1 Tax=Mycena venus TaxID=2733690 RepID=A0A8H7CZI5_9AGAR|nr:BTB domain-containing protein [Mycena venus]
MEVDVSTPSRSQRVEALWFEDGNIVIQAGNSQYRVYRGVLAARSPVFQDMLSFPQPPESELVDGCPVVRLPDNEGEVTSFLSAIFGSSSFLPHPAPTHYDTVVGVLRLSHKYGVDYLHRRALIHLSSAHRTTLSEYDKSSSYDDESKSNRPASEICSWKTSNDWAFLMVTIQLAREIDALWILPYAFYCLAVAYPRNLNQGIFHGAIYNGVAISISTQDQQSFARGHSDQCVSCAVDIVRFLFHPVDISGCTTSEKCLSARLHAIDRHRKAVRDYPSIPLDIWDENDWQSLDGLCPACLIVLKQTHQDARQAFWDKLPKIYGLPPWEELEKLKAATIGDNLFC